MKRTDEITDAEFDKVILESDQPVLIDFWADWCMPCHQVSPLVEEIANDKVGSLKVFKMNIDENPETYKKYKVMSIPTLLLFDKGEVVGRMIGAKSKEDILENLF